jgi:predicted ATPase
MRLYSVSLRAFRRYDEGWLNLESPATAIVGPNEAGKSSLLRALELLNTDDPIPPTDVSRGRPQAECQVQVRFRLTDQERASIGDLFPSNSAMWLKVSKGVDGKRKYDLDPAPTRDLSSRGAAEDEVRSLAALAWFTRWVSAEEARGPMVEATMNALASTANNLEDGELSAVDSFASALSPLADGSETVAGAPQKSVETRSVRVGGKLMAALETERVPFPDDLGAKLSTSVPEFLDFAEQFRSLKSSYNLDDEAQFKDPAMRSIAAAAGLSPRGLRDAIRSGQAGAVKTQLDQAGEAFTDFLKTNWRQSSLSVSFENQGSTLRIFVRADSADVFLLDERSDGLRIFLALISFVAARRSGADPVLLIDEAETHLHYDAQADLARVLEQQTKAASVVYTTHSIGCLPQDLGRGVRAVKPVQGADRSTTFNAWWTTEGGLTPLVVAMGAQAFGFTPARFAVFSEGPSDALLLPTLLREATGLRSLPYQIVPGISAASLERLEVMQMETPRVAFIVDGDEGGSNIAKRLLALGVPKANIIGVGKRRGSGLQVEDFLDPDIYVAAVNEELKSWRPNTGAIRANELPKTRRPQYVERYCLSLKRPAPSKLSVAAEVLKLLEGTSSTTPVKSLIGDEAYRESLYAIHGRALAALGIPADQ